MSRTIVATGDHKVLVQTGVDDQGRPVGHVEYDDGLVGPDRLILTYLVRGYWNVL